MSESRVQVLVHKLRRFCEELDRRGGRSYATEDHSTGAEQREEAFLECSDRINAIIEEAFQ